MNPYIWSFATNLNSYIRTKKNLYAFFKLRSLTCKWLMLLSKSHLQWHIKLLNYCWIAQRLDIWNCHNNYIRLNKTTSFFSPYHLYGHEKNMILCLFKLFFFGRYWNNNNNNTHTHIWATWNHRFWINPENKKTQCDLLPIRSITLYLLIKGTKIISVIWI